MARRAKTCRPPGWRCAPAPWGRTPNSPLPASSPPSSTSTPPGCRNTTSEIVASKFTSRAIFYWKYQQFSVSELPMAVGVLAMVPARASGVMFSLDPQAPEDGPRLNQLGLGPGPVRGGRRHLPGPLRGEPPGGLPHQRAAGDAKSPRPWSASPEAGWRKWPCLRNRAAPLPSPTPGPDPGGDRPGPGGAFRRAPGHRMDRGRGGQPRDPPVPAPQGEHPGLCRRPPGAPGGTGGAAAPQLRRPGGGRRRGRPGPPLPPR